MEKNGARLHGGIRTEANGGARRHGRPGCARRAHRPGARGMRWRAGDFERVVSTQAGRAGEALLPSPRRDAQDGRTGERWEGKARGARAEKRKNGAMRPPAQEQGRACRSAQQMALQLPPSRRDAHRPGAQGAQGKKGARRARGKAKERRDASARAGTGPDTARGGGEQGGAEPKKPARKGRAHRSGRRGRQSGAEIEGEMRREQPRTGAAARRNRGDEPCVAASDEPNGKHRRGVRTRYPMAGGW